MPAARKRSPATLCRCILATLAGIRRAGKRKEIPPNLLLAFILLVLKWASDVVVYLISFCRIVLVLGTSHKHVCHIQFVYHTECRY